MDRGHFPQIEEMLFIEEKPIPIKELSHYLSDKAATMIMTLVKQVRLPHLQVGLIKQDEKDKGFPYFEVTIFLICECDYMLEY